MTPTLSGPHPAVESIEDSVSKHPFFHPNHLLVAHYDGILHHLLPIPRDNQLEIFSYLVPTIPVSVYCGSVDNVLLPCRHLPEAKYIPVVKANQTKMLLLKMKIRT